MTHVASAELGMKSPFIKLILLMLGGVSLVACTAPVDDGTELQPPRPTPVYYPVALATQMAEAYRLVTYVGEKTNDLSVAHPQGSVAGDNGQQVAYIISDDEGGDIFVYWLIDGEACPLPCTTATEFAWPPVDRYLDFATGKVVDIRTGEEVLYTGDMRHVIFFER